MLLSEGLRIFFALIAVLGLIGVLSIAARKAGLVSASSGFARKRRLALVETLALDARRRVAIIKCDGKEHLIVLGANSETLIESGLTAPAEENASQTAAANPFAPLKALKDRFQKKARHAA